MSVASEARLPIFRYLNIGNVHYEAVTPLDWSRRQHCLPAPMELYDAPVMPASGDRH